MWPLSFQLTTLNVLHIFTQTHAPICTCEFALNSKLAVRMAHIYPSAVLAISVLRVRHRTTDKCQHVIPPACACLTWTSVHADTFTHAHAAGMRREKVAAAAANAPVRFKVFGQTLTLYWTLSAQTVCTRCWVFIYAYAYCANAFTFNFGYLYGTPDTLQVPIKRVST